MTMKHATPLLALTLLLGGCPGPDPEDAGTCSLDVTIGSMDTGSFVELSDGDPVELLLGFQGFRMLRLAVRGRGAEAENVEVGSFLSVAESGVELDQHTREREPTLEPDGFLVQEYLLFINDYPPAQLIGFQAELEMTVRAGGCLGGTRVTVEVRDDNPCIDHGIVLDAAVPDAAVPDGGMACE